MQYYLQYFDLDALIGYISEYHNQPIHLFDDLTGNEKFTREDIYDSVNSINYYIDKMFSKKNMKTEEQANEIVYTVREKILNRALRIYADTILVHYSSVWKTKLPLFEDITGKIDIVIDTRKDHIDPNSDKFYISLKDFNFFRWQSEREYISVIIPSYINMLIINSLAWIHCVFNTNSDNVGDIAINRDLYDEFRKSMYLGVGNMDDEFDYDNFLTELNYKYKNKFKTFVSDDIKVFYKPFKGCSFKGC